MSPIFSICIPTYNRADLLDYCLDRLAAQQSSSRPFEIVVSDNGSTDNTPAVIETHRRRNPFIHAYRLPENRGVWPNWLNAMSKAEGEFVVYLADDDSIIAENLLHHVERMERERDLVAIYTDWIAWDDQRSTEIHRYFQGVKTSISFGPDDPLGLVNFVFDQMLSPEIGVFRRDALLRAHSFFVRSLPFQLWMYRLSRLGRVAFDPLPFYREHRILQQRFQRTHWLNIEMQFQFIGDELRITLESLLLLAFHDAGVQQLPSDQVFKAKQAIDRLVHARIGLEINRACGRRDWILAVELRRRHVLWYGVGSAENARQDVLRLALPAALQAIQQTFHSLSDMDGISFRGFASRQVFDFFATHYPDVPIHGAGTAGNDAAKALIVHRDDRTLAADASAGASRHVLVLERLIDLYRISRGNVDVGEL